MQISELLCRAEYIMRAAAPRRLFPTLSLSLSFPLFPRPRAGSRRDAAVIYPARLSSPIALCN